MKKMMVVLGFITLFVLTVFVVYSSVFPQYALTEQFPVNDSQAEYFIDCSGSMYSLNVKENNLSDISGLFIGSSPVNLKPLCGQEVDVVFSIRKFKGQGICIMNKCKQTKSPVVDITSISKK
jgi:hypothetical protein